MSVFQKKTTVFIRDRTLSMKEGGRRVLYISQIIFCSPENHRAKYSMDQ